MKDHKYPYHPSEWSSDDIECAVKLYVTKSMKELRQRQYITKVQISRCINKSLERTYDNLQVIEQCLDCAVSLKSFGIPMWFYITL
jgi:hypothetical protein